MKTVEVPLELLESLTEAAQGFRETVQWWDDDDTRKRHNYLVKTIHDAADIIKGAKK